MYKHFLAIGGIKNLNYYHFHKYKQDHDNSQTNHRKNSDLLVFKEYMESQMGATIESNGSFLELYGQ